MSLLDLLRGDVVVAASLPLPYRVAATAGSAVVVADAAELGGPHVVGRSAPDILVVDAEDHETVAAVRRRIAAGQDVADRSRSSRTRLLIRSSKARLSAPAHDLVQTLVHEPVSALWVMRRPRPSPTAMVAAAALIARASRCGLRVDRPRRRRPAIDASVLRWSSHRRSSDHGRTLPRAGGRSDRRRDPAVLGRFRSAQRHVRRSPGRGVHIRTRASRTSDRPGGTSGLSSGIPLIVLAGPAADRQGPGCRASCSRGTTGRHDSRNGLARLWASALAPLDRVVFVTDTVVVHSDLRPLLDGDEFRAVSTDHKQERSRTPAGALRCLPRSS